jgi:hypothetical protein
MDFDHFKATIWRIRCEVRQSDELADKLVEQIPALLTGRCLQSREHLPHFVMILAQSLDNPGRVNRLLQRGGR